MARSSECTDSYAQKVLDAADIVRDAMLQKQSANRLLAKTQKTAGQEIIVIIRYCQQIAG